jgi:tRNA(fMet)-specific endonuclease VapC
MGLVLDSGVIIAAERQNEPFSDVIADIRQETGRTNIVLSSISVMEVEHGIYRTCTAEQEVRRRAYLDVVFSILPAQPFTVEMARIAARIDATARKTGNVIPTLDLLIGATALHFGYAVGTRNLRHFRMIPDLSIIEL